MNKIEYKINLVSNFITSQNGVIGKDFDHTFKTTLNGDPIIYGKHIKGIVRERMEQFENVFDKKYSNILGSEGNNISKVFFSNLKMNTDKFFTSNRSSVKINRSSRTAVDGSLFNYEFIEHSQSFYGHILINEELSKEELKFFLASLFHIDRIGGLKSRGLGNVEIFIKHNNDYVGISELDKIVEDFKFITKKVEKNNFKTIGLELILDSPLVLQEKNVTNIVKSRSYFQASTLRGALIQLGLNKKIPISDLLKISVKMIIDENKIKLNSCFKSKYKENGAYLFIDGLTKDLNEIYYGDIKYVRSYEAEFNYKNDDISIKIDSDTRTTKNGMLFNHEIIENNNTPYSYKFEVYIPEDLVEIEEEIYLGKYKSKGFGHAIIKPINLKNSKLSLANRINKINQLIAKDKKYISFDLFSDIILPFNHTKNILEDFKNLINIPELDPCKEKSFVDTRTLAGYSIINNIRKADELIISKGSVLTYTVDNITDELLTKLEKIENSGVGLRKKEGFGIINICTLTTARKGD